MASMTDQIGGSPPDGVTADVEYHAAVMVTMADGASLFVENAWASHQPQGGERKVLGEVGGLTFGPLKLWQETDEGKVAAEEVAFETFDTQAPANSLQRHFVQAILAGEAPMTPARHALAVTQIIDAAYRSAEAGAAVRIG